MATDPALRRLALGTLLGAFPGPTAPAWALDLLAEGLAGHTLFGNNIGTAAGGRDHHGLTRARDGVLIAIDEEGGDVTRLDHAAAARTRATPRSARSTTRPHRAGLRGDRRRTWRRAAST